MISRPNPVGIVATGQIETDLRKQVKTLHERIRFAEQDRAQWIEKQRILIEQRRGIRRPKNIPWVGANNDVWPLTDGIIRRWKPGIVSLILDADPVAYFFANKPQDIQAARDAQAFFHWQFHRIEDLKRNVM